MTQSFLRPWFALVAACLLALTSSAQTPLRVFLRGGPKTHGPGEHDHPAFVADWQPLLAARGAVVEGALRFPTREELERTDVLVLYAAEAGSIHGEERAVLEAYLARGGGLVAIHDAVCGDDPHWFKTVVGGAWEHGHAKWATGTTDLYVRDFDHPITRGVANWRFEDELYTELHLEPDAHVLMAGFQDVFTISPQMWTYEKANYRAFVAIQGHFKKSFEHDAWRTLLLRGIAWAGKRDADSLTTPEERATLAYPTGGPLRPEEARKALVLHEGFEASLAAAEPLIANPISIDWDPRGRMWVAETPGYPMKEKSSGIPAHDTISVLEDSDGDGVMDRKLVFADKLDLVTSFVFHQDGVIALAAPDILFLRDTDGDGVCDRREILFTGFGYGDTHAVMSNARWGLDGWIYATQGYSGNIATDIRNSEPNGGRLFGRIGNGLFRFKPDGSFIEMVSSYGSNTWGLDFTPEGELFFSMANGAHLRHVVVPERALANARLKGTESWADVPDHDRVEPLVVRNEEAYRQIDFVGGFTAASGCAVYDGGAWPAAYEGRVFVAEPTVNLVHEDVLTPKGSTFSAAKSRREEFLASADLWFRPVHMRVGPDGALYVLDFYNQAAVHNDTRGPEHGPTNAALRPDRDRTHGRVWRVQHRAARPVAGAPLASNDAPALMEALDSPNGWRRGTALRLFTEQQALDANAALEQLVSSTREPRTRIAALWSLARRKALGQARLESLLQDRETSVRRQAIEVAGEFKLTGFLREALARQVSPDSPRITLSALGWLSRVHPDPSVLGRLAAVYTAPTADRWMRSLVLAVAAGDPVQALQLARKDPRSREGQAFDDYQLALVGVIAGQGNGINEARVVRMVAEEPRPGLDLRMLERLAGERRGDELPPWTPELRAALSRLMSSPDFAVASIVLGFAARWDTKAELVMEVQALGERLEREARDREQAAEGRVGRLRTLLSIKARRAAALEIAESMLAPETPPAVQLALIAELGRANDDGACAVLARRFAFLAPAAREQAFAFVVRRGRWVEPLLAEVEAGRLSLNDLGPQRTAQLKHHPDEAAAQRARSVFEKLQGAATLKTDELIAQLLPIVEAPGDVVRGKQLFAENCGNCHTYQGQGGNVGPDLTGMGSHGIRALLPVILDPNASVEAAYLEFVAETNDERLITGIVVRDTLQSIVLRSTSGDVELARFDVASLRSTGRSPMPEGLASIGAEGLRDVLAYLTADYAGFRVLDLREHFNMSSHKGMYDPDKAPDRMDLLRSGVIDVDGVPFELRDPAKSEGGRNALCLRGGMNADWFSRTGLPKKVAIPVGFALERMHVLGGIAAWGFPIRDDKQPCVRWTWVYADGSREEVVLHDGVEFADWIGRRDVPGSKYVEDLVKPGSWGQIRTFDLAPGQRKVVAAVEIESYDNHLSPTFFGLTAELTGAVRKTSVGEVEPLDVLVVGGGSSHDFASFFRDADLATLAAQGIASARYTEGTGELLSQLPMLKTLCLTNNQPLAGEALRQALWKFFDGGGGLVLVHPATWFNWSDWPEFNARWVGGGARNHERFAEFEVRVVDPQHALARGVPETFRVQDELYETVLDPSARTHVVAVGKSLATGKEYPVLWTVERPKGRTACLTLGHDGAAHGSAAYQTLYVNAVRWTLEGR